MTIHFFQKAQADGRLHFLRWLGVAAMLLSSSLVFQSCKKQAAATATAEPLKDKPAGFLLRRYERNEFLYDWAGMKIDAEVMTMGETQGFKANVRMRHDSLMWISITPALGIEVFRVLISPDSVKYISKIPDNKYYYIGGFELITEAAKIDLDFSMLQDLILGNAIGLEKDEGKFRTEIDDNKYLLISKYKRRVRRVVGVDDRKLEANDTIVVNPNDPRYQRTIRKKEEEDLIVSRYWLEPGTYRLVKSVFNDLYHQRTVVIEYSDFVEEGEQSYPTRCKVSVRDANGQQDIEFRITKLSLNKPYEFPFEIPEDMERRTNPGK